VGLVVTAFVAAVAFLTRVPVGRAPEGPPTSATVRWFPAVGALVGLATALAYRAGHWAVGPLAGAALAVGVQVLVTGAFHEDGLADTADAAGGWSRDERFRILDDPRHGTYGVLALVLAVALRIALIATLPVGAAFAVLPAAHAVSRGIGVALMGLVPPASTEGLGASSVRGLLGRDALLGTVLAALIAIVLLAGWALPVLAAVAFVGVAMATYARRTLAGIAGDLLGATQQLSELATLVVLVAALRHGAALPWWS
jgi:adenosylcobinamide-GDP ribazoletransferase